MKHFRILVNGEQFCMKMNGGTEVMGFYVQKVVQARDSKEAEMVAVEIIRTDDKLLNLLINSPDYQPKLSVEEIEEVEANFVLDNLGYSFYLDEQRNK